MTGSRHDIDAYRKAMIDRGVDADGASLLAVLEAPDLAALVDASLASGQADRATVAKQVVAALDELDGAEHEARMRHVLDRMRDGTFDGRGLHERAADALSQALQLPAALIERLAAAAIPTGQPGLAAARGADESDLQAPASHVDGDAFDELFFSADA